MPEQEENLGESLSKVLKAVVRRRWWVIVTASAVAIGACVVSLVLPDRYQSEATILVERQEVPERYVAANSTTDVH